MNILHSYRHIMPKCYFSEIPKPKIPDCSEEEKFGYGLGIAKNYRVGYREPVRHWLQQYWFILQNSAAQLGVVYFAECYFEHNNGMEFMQSSVPAKWLLADTHQAFLIACQHLLCTGLRATRVSGATHESLFEGCLPQILWWPTPKGATG